ncbi:NPCBM/NEW2 domain-containing protein [Kamptonema formosum]|uniref:NPCBM/NEW2 domain-containing protein n=1 Tax=Kamptonema formosum TaxID=331992 RepID=UPI0008FBF9D2|nr:NPCBM/NEW2 domain-containing protein [Oscillatoria sp. PCC 10802]
MKRFRLLSRLLSAGMLSAMLGTLAAQVAQAQRPIPLSELKCLQAKITPGYNWSYRAESEDISVGREFYTSIAWIRQGSTLTCRLPGGRASFRLELGIPDASKSSPLRIDVYLDGNKVASRTVDQGKAHTILLDITNGKSLAVEVSCASDTSCYGDSTCYFIKAQVEPAATSPSSPGSR